MRPSHTSQGESISNIDQENTCQSNENESGAESCVLPLHMISNDIVPAGSCALLEAIANDDFQSEQNMGPSCPANTPTGPRKQTFDSPTPLNITKKIALLEAETYPK
jgi:hypothetical protein